eukprot:scaffold5438_cov237-Pinguiococcus_pyrenoidosus.AAC.1
MRSRSWQEDEGEHSPSQTATTAHLEVWHHGSKGGERLREEVVAHDGHQQANADREDAHVTQDHPPNRLEDLVGKLVGLDCCRLGLLKHVDLVHLVVEVAVHRRGMHRAHERLRRSIDGRKRRRNVARHGGREDDTALELLVDKNAQEVVRDGHGRRDVALEVAQLLGHRLAVEEPGHQVSGIVKDALHVNVLGRLHDRVQVGRSGRKDAADLAELLLRELLLRRLEGLGQEVVVQTHDDDVKALASQAVHELATDPAATASDKGPGGVVLLLQIRHR